MLLNGAQVAGTIPRAQLQDGDMIEVALGAVVQGDSGIRRVDADPYAESPAVFGPREPRIDSTNRTLAMHGCASRRATTRKSSTRFTGMANWWPRS
ncbi:hypothetical protein [Massilia sp. Dwa41.01b]|uniref:hypothetical protein n=1 Tax=Massilia sp. Dwa41.01b TaxID=2709302 RepID=UPI001E3984E7|nr:hypothetical protein [Massilia sp. Dwa41.01b]